MLTKEDSERRYAQLEGERDYHKRRADRMDAKNTRLRDAMKAARVYAGDLPPQQGLVIVDLLERGMREVRE